MVHLGFVRTSPAGGESAKEMSSTRLHLRRQHQLLLRQAAGENGACPADEPPTPPAWEGAEAGAGDPGEGTVPRPVTSMPGHRPDEK